jgi:hypothetical protein
LHDVAIKIGVRIRAPEKRLVVARKHIQLVVIWNEISSPLLLNKKEEERN